MVNLNKGATVELVKALSDERGAALRGNTSGTVLRTYLTHNEIDEVLTG